jgi:hypothetical protein
MTTLFRRGATYVSWRVVGHSGIDGSALRVLIAVSERVSNNVTRRDRSAQLAAGGDPELRACAVQVRADRAMGEIQPLADLAIRHA